MLKNVLLVVSPANINPIVGQEATALARRLKDAGASRVDLSEDPYIRYTLETLEKTPEALRSLRGYYPQFATFGMVARPAVDYIFRPIVGQSDMILSHGINPRMLELYARHAGKMVAKHPTNPQWDKPGKSNDLGFAFYLAHQGRTENGYPYDHVVFMGMSRLEKLVLERPGLTGTLYIDHNITAINLARMRQVLQAQLYHGSTAALN